MSNLAMHERGFSHRSKKTRSRRQRTPQSNPPLNSATVATRLLSNKEVEEALCHLPGWSRQGNKLHRQYHFSSFEKALGFLCGLALVAQSAEHHLQESEVYDSVTVDLTTPELGGIAQVDVTLAEKADVLANAILTASE